MNREQFPGMEDTEYNPPAETVDSLDVFQATLNDEEKQAWRDLNDQSKVNDPNFFRTEIHARVMQKFHKFSSGK